jgi:mycothiol system anti-sigma-R factor
MSCGNAHDTPCTQVLSLVHQYIDGEVAEVERLQIVQHLEECPPCVQQFSVMSSVKIVVHRSCCPAPAPEELRMQIVTRIRQVSVTYRAQEQGE